ncbi:MAG: M18 family aminopeptidase [Lachnospiraceae bacterium]|nr:M18 family aminopeptidase [Lachnospiraceae bacterium]
MMNRMDEEQINAGLMRFLDASPNAYYAVRNMCEMLTEAGFEELREEAPWKLKKGGSYYVTRNGSALISFRIPEDEIAGYQIMASHSDSPSFKIKPNAEIDACGNYTVLNTEKYGGMLCGTWFDRPLSAAGRVAVETEQGVEMRLVNLDQDLLIIPSLAIHMNREANDGYKFNAQKDLLPLSGELASKGAFMKLVAEAAGTTPEKILDTDLFLYNRMPAARIGTEGEFIASGRLDDLQCAYASLLGIMQAKPAKSLAVQCVFDNEEVGSMTKQGAAATFLRDTLRRINIVLGRSEEEILRSPSSSFMVSADNAHAVHPNYPEKADPTNRPAMNKGIVIKYSANQKYTTDAAAGAVFRRICDQAAVPYQTFANRSDMLGGSTLGNISQSQLSLNTVDIGLPQLAMHSSYELAGAKDTAWLAAAAVQLFSSSVRADGAQLILE